MSMGGILGIGSDSKAILDALDKALAMIQFDPAGKILSANKNFCKMMGYQSSEIVGQHHSMFVEPDYARSAEYKEFWAKLARGEVDARLFRRIGKGGKAVWIGAYYSPVFNSKGKVVKVVKAASDITRDKVASTENEGRLNAISRAQAAIEFKPDGTIQFANENFLNAMGYSLDEIQGKHHRMFVDSAYAQSTEYQEFWNKLRSGEFIADEFLRIGKGGKQVWIQASYNPIFDPNKRVVKVIKFATDITERVRAVKEIGDGLKRLAEGDLVQRIDRPFIPALDKLRVDFNSALEQLEGVLSNVVSSADQIRSGIQDIAAAAEESSKRTEQQAASLEETTATVVELNTTVKHSAEGAIEGRKLVSSAKVEAEKSNEVVLKAVGAIRRIEKSSENIGQIIGTIDEIAFQTNLLALNAGVEAARAGETGRGFAVVAAEVRALAQRSAEAAKEIKALISTSISEVGSGVNLVVDTGKALERITSQVVELNNVVSSFADRASEESSALEQISIAVGQMDTNTQNNAAMMEEATAATHSLRNEVEELMQSIAVFKINQTKRRDRPQKERTQKSRLKLSRGTTRLAVTRASVTQGATALKVENEPIEEGGSEF
ncbi:MAG TPA: methyl-accepting chemotaxis protein [Methylocella sp.]|nr:methyl-accepting chemotaxis protein [Methylocella sp.]